MVQIPTIARVLPQAAARSDATSCALPSLPSLAGPAASSSRIAIMGLEPGISPLTADARAEDAEAASDATSTLTRLPKMPWTKPLSARDHDERPGKAGDTRLSGKRRESGRND